LGGVGGMGMKGVPRLKPQRPSPFERLIKCHVPDCCMKTAHKYTDEILCAKICITRSNCVLEV